MRQTEGFVTLCLKNLRAQIYSLQASNQFPFPYRLSPPYEAREQGQKRSVPCSLDPWVDN